MEGDSGDWEQCKENIQPLRHGRTMSSLQAALAPQCQDELKRKRREFEELLRTTSGVDLLDVYYRYVVWVEQHFPAGGHGVNLRQLMEQAVAQFSNSRELFNDERYVGIWLRYVSLSSEPLAVLKAMYETDVGVQHACFFATWAEHLEAAGDSRRASRVLHAGINRCAEPTSLLEEALRHLEVRVSQQVAQGAQEQAQQLRDRGAVVMEDVRLALAPLRARGKRGTAPVIRTGPLARPAEQQPRGVLALVRAGQAAGNHGHTKVRVHADENAPPEDVALLSVPTAPPVPCIIGATTQGQGKENNRMAGQWAGVTAKQRPPAVSRQPNFEIPEDECGQPPPCTPVLIPGSGTALSVRRELMASRIQQGGRLEGWTVPMALHEPPDPTKRAMYDKASVYRGATEFQFEELRVAAMHARQRRLAEERLQRERERADLLELERQAEVECERAARCERELAMMRQRKEQRQQAARPSSGSNEEVVSQSEQLRCEVLRLRRELEEMRVLLASTRSGTRDYTQVADRIGDLERTIGATEQSMLAGHCEGLPTEAIDEHPGEHTPSGVQQRVSSTASPPGSAQSGGSLRTVDVSRVVRGLWNCSLAQSRLEPPSPQQQAPAADAVGDVQVEAEHNTSAAAPTTGSISVAKPFEVFCEPTQAGSLACSAGMPVGALQADDGNDENRPPTNYSPPELLHQTKRLQERMPFAELGPEVQQGPANGNAEDEGDVLQGIEPLPDDTNFTYAPSKSFVRKMTSTPFASEETVPKVGEDFTVGGLTALVQRVVLEGDDHFMPPLPVTSTSSPDEQLVTPQATSGQVVQQQCQPGGESQVPATADAAVVPLARRRFSTAADLSTILECSKEGKSSSSSSGASNGSSSSHHTVGTTALSTTSRPLTGGSSCLPAVREEEQDDSGNEVFAAVPAVSAEAPAESSEPVRHDNGTEGAMCDMLSPDPFSQELRSCILSSWQLRESDQQLLFESAKGRPILKPDALVRLGGQDVKVLRHLASGAYARVYMAEVISAEESYVDTDDSFQPPVHDKVVLKLNPDASSSSWEFYICCELRRRLAEAFSGAPVRCVADLQMGCFFPKGAILVFPYSPYGTLLDVVGRYQKQQGKQGVPECLALYFALELFIALDLIHSCGIIHADVKPDNVLIIDFPSELGFLQRFAEHSTNCVQLIDFGRSIDMSQLPPKTTFTQVVETDGFTCTEMRDGRPWTYQTDWFGMLGCLHMLLFGEYMEVEKLPNGAWGIQRKFKRYWQQDLWSRIFSTLLNIPSCEEQPYVTPFAIEIQGLLQDKSRAYNVVVEALRAKNF